MKSLRNLLEEHDACEEGVAWALQYETSASAWDACERPDWMLLAIDSVGVSDPHKNRLFAIWCARHTPLGDGRTTWDLLSDERSRRAVEVAELFAAGKATEEELSAARSAAESAAESAARSAARSAESAQANALRQIYGNPFSALQAEAKGWRP